MNYLFRSSWINNTSLITESTEQDAFLLNESIASIIGDVMKKMKAAKIGIPYRDARLFFYEFLKDKYADRIPPEFADEFATRKPQGKDINALMGKIMLDEKLPEGFADKLAKDFDEYSKEKVSLGDKEVDAVTAFLNQAAGLREIRGSKPGQEMKKKFGTMQDIEKAVQTGGVSAEERLKKGNTGLETLQLNLSPDTTFNLEDQTPMGHSLYTAVKDGLKYRVTLKNANGEPLKLSQFTPDNIASVVVTEPGTMQRIKAPTVPGVAAPGVEREKPLADFPDVAKDDFSGPDPEELAYGGGDDELPDVGEEPDVAEVKSEPEPTDEGEGETDEKEPGAEDVTAAEKETEEPEFTATQAAERKKNYWERLKEKDPELYKKAWAKRQATLSGEEDIEPEAEKPEKPDTADDEDEKEEDCEYAEPPLKIIIKKSSNQLQREMLEQIRLKKQNQFKTERRNTLGY